MSSRRYSKEHEWVTVEDSGIAIIGISQYASDQLGDIVFINFLKGINSKIEADETCVEIEAIKGVSPVYSPIGGTIIAVNDLLALEENTKLINEDPYGKGWLFKIQYINIEEIELLMDEEDYLEYIGME